MGLNSFDLSYLSLSVVTKLPVVLTVLIVTSCNCTTWLHADGNSEQTYKLINQVLGGNAIETTDCSHPTHGPHITQVFDTSLNRSVFAFDIHVAEDSDRCQKSDRQRVEIKTYGPSPNELKGYENETVTLSWNFKLSAEIQTSRGFTAIHQIKPKGGDDKLPVTAIILRTRGKSQFLQVTYNGRDAITKLLDQDALKNYKGVWIHALEKLRYAKNGSFSLILKNALTGQLLMTVTKENIDFWRNGSLFMRPKWGIYRSFAEASMLRDERVLFDSFCLSKGADTTDTCV